VKVKVKRLKKRVEEELVQREEREEGKEEGEEVRKKAESNQWDRKDGFHLLGPSERREQEKQSIEDSNRKQVEAQQRWVKNHVLIVDRNRDHGRGFDLDSGPVLVNPHDRKTSSPSIQEIQSQIRLFV